VRLYVYLILLLLVLGAPFAMRAVLLQTQMQPAGVGAGGPIAGKLVIVTPHNQDIRREFGRAFAAWHREKYGTAVQLDFRTPGGTNDIQRMLETTYRPWVRPDGIDPAMPAGIDIVWGGGDFFFDNTLNNFQSQFGKYSVLQPIDLAPELLHETFPSPLLAGVKLYDYRADADGKPLPPRWVGVCLSSFGIVYSPDLYQSLGLAAPNTWHDLADERLAGLVALADPTHSGSVAVAYEMLIQRAMADREEELFGRMPELKAMTPKARQENVEYCRAIDSGWKQGMRDLLLMAANARYFTDSATQVAGDVANGEAAAGVAIDFYGRVYQESVGSRRCTFIMPRGATAITPDPIGILYGVKGKQKELATHFVEFMLTKPAQLLWILRPGQSGGPAERSLRRPPIRRDLYADRAGWADDVDPFNDAAGFNQRGEWMTLFGDERMFWAAAWIDSRDGLKDAYDKIRVVPDPQFRAQLIAKLADLPVERKDVEDYQRERRQAERDPAVNAEEWKARQRIRWARTFREHYAGVAAEAR
jgi:ABC-type Fe3+ transport system substrate-binding protein